MFDKRGTGLSDRVDTHHLPSLETRMDDVRAVMDAVGSGRGALLGASEGGPMSILFAATYPARTRALILYVSYAHFHSWVMGREALEDFIAEWKVADLADLEKSGAALGKIDAHKKWSKDMEPHVVSGSAHWEI